MDEKLTRYEVPGNPVAYSVIEYVVDGIAATKESIRILEIGSFRGASAVTFAGISKKNFLDFQLVCCDAWGKIGAQENLNYQHFLSVLKKFGVGGVIELVGFSSKTLGILAERSFDVVYVDGYHGVTQVLSDLEFAKRLIKPGGVIFGDDYDCPPSLIKSLRPLQLDEDFHQVGLFGCHPGVVSAVGKTFGYATKTFGSVWGFVDTGTDFVELDFRGRHYSPSVNLDEELLRCFLDHNATESGLPSNHPFVGEI